MKLLVIGSGGREHALAWRLSKSPGLQKIYVAPGNAGTAHHREMENLNITDERLAELGASGFLPPLATSCMNHEGSGKVKFQQWDGTKWNVITDWIDSDQSLVRPMIEESAAKYAAEKGITPRDCSKEM